MSMYQHKLRWRWGCGVGGRDCNAEVGDLLQENRKGSYIRRRDLRESFFFSHERPTRGHVLLFL